MEGELYPLNWQMDMWIEKLIVLLTNRHLNCNNSEYIIVYKNAKQEVKK